MLAIDPPTLTVAPLKAVPTIRTVSPPDDRAPGAESETMLGAAIGCGRARATAAAASRTPAPSPLVAAPKGAAD